MKLTMEDIAKICNVSRGTVNRALYNKPNINPETKKKILRVIEELGYSPDYIGQTLATGKSNTIGLILPNIINEFSAMLYTYIEQICSKNGVLLTLATSNDDPYKEEMHIDTFINRRFDGIIMFSINKNSDRIKKIIDKDIPLVLILNKVEGISCNYVCVDEYNSVNTAVQDLIEKNHKDIVYIDGIRNYSSNYNKYSNDIRFKAYKDTLRKNNIKFIKENYIEFLPEYYDNDNLDILKELINRKNVPTAIMCFHDRIAVWVLTGLKHLNINVPQDISLIGFDDINELKHIEPKLTTIRTPILKIAKESIRILQDNIKSGKLTNTYVQLKSKYIVRESIRDLLI